LPKVRINDEHAANSALRLLGVVGALVAIPVAAALQLLVSGLLFTNAG
jgi:hypothetical protein